MIFFFFEKMLKLYRILLQTGVVMNVINDIRLTKILEILLNLQYDNYKDISNIH